MSVNYARSASGWLVGGVLTDALGARTAWAVAAVVGGRRRRRLVRARAGDRRRAVPEPVETLEPLPAEVGAVPVTYAAWRAAGLDARDARRGRPRRATSARSRARSRSSRTATRSPTSSSATSIPDTGRAYAVGVTGPPGVGKSSLITALVRHVREQEQHVGVISVDPSSPFTQGALLGDRIRLADHFLDPGVFIRSMGTRGHLGGLAEATLQALLVLDAAGKDLVFLETVGAGQSEVEVIGIADTVAARAHAGLGRLRAGAEGGDHGDSRT